MTELDIHVLLLLFNIKYARTCYILYQTNGEYFGRKK